jgi:AcrR family transcriptional regulator
LEQGRSGHVQSSHPGAGLALAHFLHMATDTRETIEKVALELFERLGYHATTMRMIATGANVRSASLYYWYPGKEALLLSLINRFLDELNREVVAAVDKETDTIRRLAAAVRAHVVFHGQHRLAAVVTDVELRGLGEENRRHVTAMRDAYQERFFDLIEDGISSGALRTRWPRVATYITLLTATSVDIWFRADGPLSLEDVADAHVEFVLGGLRLDDEALEEITGPAAGSEPPKTPRG